MADIKGRTIAATYGKLLYTSTDDGLVGNTGSTTSVITTDDMDGTSTASCLNLGIDRVGIGTFSPKESLHIETVADDSVDAWALRLGNTIDDDNVGRTGVGFVARSGSDYTKCGIMFEGIAAGYNKGKLHFLMEDTGDTSEATIADDAAMTIDSNSKVGIGTASPSAQLHLDGAANASAHATDETVLPSFRVEPTGTSKCLDFGVKSAEGAWIQARDRTDYADSSSNSKVLNLNPTGGNVGIGTATPDGILELENSDAVCNLIVTTFDDAASTTSALVLRTGDDSGAAIDSGDFLGIVRFNGCEGSSTFQEGAQIRATADENWSGSARGTHMSFHTVDNTTTTLDEKMRIDHNGNVGIGTASPDFLFEVEKSSAGATISSAVRNPDNSNVASHAQLFCETGGASGGDPLLHLQVDGVVSWSVGIDNSDSDKLKISPSGTVGTNTVMTFATNGNVGIGTTSPGALLHISGSAVDGTQFILESTGATSDDAAPELVLYRNANLTDAGNIGRLVFKGLDSGGAGTEYASIYGEIDDETDGTEDGNIRFDTFVAGSTGTRMIINEGNVGIGTAAPASLLTVHESASATYNLEVHNKHASTTGQGIASLADKSAAADFYFFSAKSNHTSSSTQEAYLRGDGIWYTSGTTVETLDYAEYFESIDGKSIALGTSVVLINDKIRAAVDGETPFGVISSTIGNGSGGLGWSKRFLKDDYSATIWEDYSIKEWTDEDGKYHGYPSDEIPNGLTVPSDAEVTTGHKRRKANPDYDDSKEYKSREERDEWNSVGLVGQVPITKGQPVSSSWIKMKEVSNTVDMYYVFPCSQVIN